MANPLLHAIPVEGAESLQRISLKGLDFPAHVFETVARDLFDENALANQVVDGQSPPIVRLLRADIDTPSHAMDVLANAWEQSRGLRHAKVIDSADATIWISNLLANEPSRLSWHIDRLDGISASSGWAYLAEARGERSFFTTARALDESRLMKRLPVEPTWPMYRGTMLEEVAKRTFYREYPAFQSSPADHMAVRSLRGTPDMPWLIGNPDDYAYNVRGNDKTACLIDYKCPTQPKDERLDPPMDYRVQLHHYALMAIAAQRPVKRMIVANFYTADDIARLWADMIDRKGERGVRHAAAQAAYMLDHKLPLVQINLQPMAIDKDLLKEMIRVYREADRRVMEGRLSDWPRKKEIDIDPAALARAQQIESSLSRTLVFQKALDDHSKSMKSEMKQIFDGVRLGGLKQPLPTLSVQAPKEFDLEKAVEYLKAKGFDTRSLCTVEEKEVYSKDLVKKALTGLGAPVEAFEETGFKIGLTLSKKGPGFEAIANMKERSQYDIRSAFPYAPASPPAAPLAPEAEVAESFAVPTGH